MSSSLEAARSAPVFFQFGLTAGEAGVGLSASPPPIPVTEADPPRPSPVCSALSKGLEELLLEQYYRQYDLNGCCLRAP